ncbi:MAG TPA: glutamate-5-semialdehyde dehydrogenase [Candidatus Gallibacteroides avistercoris]|uniref:Gamma-glutamyl phosphate reductase n=1 Tax=Candidatus Gallibacteroides avistercoris TaxID=2840833 RepID=A0A9D1M9G1_9BACT|nr:glutamate-5-semialdehyde dehydrogenase [Candidatus Gallibacteroides avistercoris]
MNCLNDTFRAVKAASRQLNLIDEKTINSLLCAVADEAEKSASDILAENTKDLALMEPSDPKYDRLKLTRERIQAIAADMRQVAQLPSPLGKVLSKTVRPNGMEITKVSVPFGVVGIIYEARPNVSFDVFSLCLKSGNACILKGSHDAHNSNRAIVEVINRVLITFGIDPHTVVLLPADREATAQLLQAVEWVDLIIPRGSQALINYVRNNSKVPVIETGAGICHTYFDAEGDLAKGRAIVNNAKTRRVSVCNALDCLLIDRSRLGDLPQLCAPLADSQVVIYADEQAFAALQGGYPSTLLEHAVPESFGTEFLSYKMAVKTVDGLDGAIEHIARYSSKHSEAIVSENPQHIARFFKEVDAACVYGNVSTAFTDGGQFGFGAEIGISTQKLHARGPMALPEMTSYKYLITGNGQIRS